MVSRGESAVDAKAELELGTQTRGGTPDAQVGSIQLAALWCGVICTVQYVVVGMRAPRQVFAKLSQFGENLVSFR